MNPSIYVIATADTKGEEQRFVAEQVRLAFPQVRTIDVGTRPANVAVDVTNRDIAAFSSAGANAVEMMDDRARAIAAMSDGLVKFLSAEFLAGRIAGVIGIGGSGGTSLICPALRALPIGLPKFMVSTVASGNVGPYVDCSDITMMYSVVDVAGLNRISREVLGNAAAAIAGMVRRPLLTADVRPAVGLTMFGVTTVCVNAVRQVLQDTGFDPIVFHATGAGGRAMEKLVQSGMLQAVLDITTTEVADEVVGGIFPAGPLRMDAILEARIPYLLSLGALDMVNFGAKETVPAKFADRQFHVHNAQVTLMRTTASELRSIGEWVAAKLTAATSPVVLLIPERGVSALDAPGQAFYAPEADKVLFETLEEELANHRWVQVRRIAAHINDPEMSAAIFQEFSRLYG
jgi:uncharacterized protein (UPF0261 family)